MISVNEYFEGSVKSLGFTENDGRASVGVMLAGEYTFTTSQPEEIAVVSGAMTIRQAGEEEWETFEEGESFYVPGNSHFDIRLQSTVAYLCRYL